jgi:hypothetical protein
LAELLIFFSSASEGSFEHLVYSDLLSWEKFSNFLRSYASAFRQSHLIHPEAPVVTLPGIDELKALPDYIRSIWLSFSLRGLLERGPFLTECKNALKEVLTLGNWAAKNTQRMSATSCTAVGI